MPGVSLTKRPLVDLTKDAGRALRALGLGGVNLDVELILDRSGSMQDEYAGGLVQLVLERVFAAVKQVDPDESLPVTLFHNSCLPAPTLTAGNLEGYVTKNLSGMSWGGTSYSYPLRKLYDKHKLNGWVSKTPAEKAKLAIFITDGENDDAGATLSAMKELSGAPVFVVFVGLDTSGRASFPMLEKLDDMVGRKFDNADYFRWDSSVTDEQFYQLLFKEVAKALQEMKRLSLIK
jgi:hypothetical protein